MTNLSRFGLLLGTFLYFVLIGAARAQELIPQDIGAYEWEGRVYGSGGVLAGSARTTRTEDRHAETAYNDRTRDLNVRVTVSRYPNPDWLLHEMDGGFGLVAPGPPVVTIANEEGRRRFQYLLASPSGPSSDVSWTSGTSTVIGVLSFGGPSTPVEYPVEVIDAYLSLYPSTLPASIEDTPAHHTQWIRDEMRRILEYAARDLSNARRPAPTDPSTRVAWEAWRGDVEKWINRFADFRERFFGTASSRETQQAIFDANLAHRLPGTRNLDVPKHLDWLEARLQELQTWWAAHENDAVSLPTPPTTPATTVSPLPSTSPSASGP